MAAAWALADAFESGQDAQVGVRILVRLWNEDGELCIEPDCYEGIEPVASLDREPCGFQIESGTFTDGSTVTVRRSDVWLDFRIVAAGARAPLPAYVSAFRQGASDFKARAGGRKVSTGHARAVAWDDLAVLVPGIPIVGSAEFASFGLASSHPPPRLDTDIDRASLAEFFLAAIVVVEGGTDSVSSFDAFAGAAHSFGLTDRLVHPLDRMARDMNLDVPNRIRAAYMLRHLQARAERNHPFRMRASRGFPRAGGAFRTELDALAWVDALGARHSCIECRFLWPAICR